MLDAFASIIPPGLSWPDAAVLISGFFELLGAVGILLPRFRALAGWGLVVLTICVTPANVYMWLHPERFPQVPEWLLLWRLPFQVLLLLCILASTQRRFPGWPASTQD
ncbi:MAG: DoxX family protein [Salinicola sp.]|nr:DoxX family protein [Salinicola sp.]